MPVFDIDVNGRARMSLLRAEQLVDEAVHLTQRLRANLYQLDEKRRSAAADGYTTRSSSRFDGFGGGALTGDGHRDPLGDLVADEATGDAEDKGPIRRAYREGSEVLADVVIMLRAAEGATTKALRPPTAGDGGPKTELGCLHHHEHGYFAATSNPWADLCDDCKAFMAGHDGRRPNRDELIALEDVRLARELVRRRRAGRQAKAA